VYNLKIENMKTLKDRTSYVKSKAKMVEDMQKSLNNKFIFDIYTIFDDKRTYKVFKNLKESDKKLYIIITESFFEELDAINDFEKLVWMSDILECINNNNEIITKIVMPTLQNENK